MVKKSYIPARGDMVLLNFSPQKGREQAGYRPALIISPLAYNRMASLALMCPITNSVKGLSFEVALTREMQTTGVVLVDQVKSLDWRSRKIKFIEKAPQSFMEEVLAKLEPLVT